MLSEIYKCFEKYANWIDFQLNYQILVETKDNSKDSAHSCTYKDES